MEKIKFSTYVRNNIRENGMKLARLGPFGSTVYFVESTRWVSSRFQLASEPEEKDSWELFFTRKMFGGYTVRLYRGPEKIEIDLDKAEQMKFVQLYKKCKADYKEKQKQEKHIQNERERKKKELAQWWP